MHREIVAHLLAHLVPRFGDENLLPGVSKPRGRLRLSPAQVLVAIRAYEVATWALQMSRRLQPRALPRRPGGRPRRYSDMSILLMAVVQALWRKSYRQIVDWVAVDAALAQALGLSGQPGQPQVISQGQYWTRRQALGLWPFLFFFLGLAAQLIRLGVLTGTALVVDSTLLQAWRHEDPDAAWVSYARRRAVWGYKVHVVLCRTSQLPLLVAVTPANVHDSVVGWLLVGLVALLFRLKTWVVYADAAYFDRRFFGVVTRLVGAHPAVDYNPRRRGKRQLTTFFFIGQWRRLVLGPRSAVERHFAWVKRYFGLKYFQCYTWARVSQYVLLTYIAVLAVALAAQRYQRPDLLRRRSMVLAHV